MKTALDLGHGEFADTVGEAVVDRFAHGFSSATLHALSELALNELEDDGVDGALCKDEPARELV